MPLPSFATNSNAPTSSPGFRQFLASTASLFCSAYYCSLSDVDIPPLATLLCTESRSVCTVLWAMLIVNLEFCEFHSLSHSFTHDCSLCLLFLCLNVHVCCAAAEYAIVSVNAICSRALCARSLLDKCECRMRGICQV